MLLCVGDWGKWGKQLRNAKPRSPLACRLGCVGATASAPACLPAISVRLRVPAQAGAAHVYGIDMSAIAESAQQIVADNGFADRITIIRGKVGPPCRCNAALGLAAGPD